MTPAEVPAQIAELLKNNCIWHVTEPGVADRYVAAGPDHDIRPVYPRAQCRALFNRDQRERLARRRIDP